MPRSRPFGSSTTQLSRSAAVTGSTAKAGSSVGVARAMCSSAVRRPIRRATVRYCSCSSSGGRAAGFRRMSQLLEHAIEMVQRQMPAVALVGDEGEGCGQRRWRAVRGRRARSSPAAEARARNPTTSVRKRPSSSSGWSPGFEPAVDLEQHPLVDDQHRLLLSSSPMRRTGASRRDLQLGLVLAGEAAQHKVPGRPLHAPRASAAAACGRSRRHGSRHRARRRVAPRRALASV